MAARFGSRRGAAGKMASGDLGRAQILNLGEPEVRQLGSKLVRIKLTQKRFAQLSDTGDAHFMACTPLFAPRCEGQEDQGRLGPVPKLDERHGERPRPEMFGSALWVAYLRCFLCRFPTEIITYNQPLLSASAPGRVLNRIDCLMRWPWPLPPYQLARPYCTR